MRLSAERKRLTNDMAKKIRDNMTDAQKRKYNELKKAVKMQYDKTVEMNKKWEKYEANPSKKSLHDALKDVIEADKFGLQVNKLFGEPGTDDCDAMISAYEQDM